MKDIGEMHHFWGVAIQRRSGLFLLQWQYVLNTLRQASIATASRLALLLILMPKCQWLMGLQSVIRLGIAALLMLFGISSSLSSTSRMQFNKFASICMIPLSLTYQRLSASYVICKGTFDHAFLLRPTSP